MSKKYKVILISGGFDPVHKGHIQCIQNARELADEVWIGLNNDSWLRRKKGKSFMKEQERAFVMDNIKGVDWVYIMNPKIHNDDTACDFIDASRHKWMRERGTWEDGIMAFGNGGDRVAGGVSSGSLLTVDKGLMSRAEKQSDGKPWGGSGIVIYK